jgi:predicted metal-binding protein
MANHHLIICEHCGFSPEHDDHEGLSGGTHLLNQLKPLYEQWSRQAELEIQTTGCLCVCDRPCAIAFVGTNKFTYLFSDLSPLDCATDLIAASELYLDSDNGWVNGYDLPPTLRSKRLARIPPAP